MKKTWTRYILDSGKHFIVITVIMMIALRWFEHHLTIKRSMHFWLKMSGWIE